MASREPGGDAVTPAPGGRVFHPHGLFSYHGSVGLRLSFQACDFDFLSVISHRTNRTCVFVL